MNANLIISYKWRDNQYIKIICKHSFCAHWTNSVTNNKISISQAFDILLLTAETFTSRLIQTRTVVYFYQVIIATFSFIEWFIAERISNNHLVNCRNNLLIRISTYSLLSNRFQNFISSQQIMGALLSSSRNGVPTAMASKFVSEAIASDKVVIFSKSYCPYCTMAKEVSDRTDFISILFLLIFFRWLNPIAIPKIATRIHRHWNWKPRWLCGYSGCLGTDDWRHFGKVPARQAEKS